MLTAQAERLKDLLARHLEGAASLGEPAPERFRVLEFRVGSVVPA